MVLFWRTAKELFFHCVHYVHEGGISLNTEAEVKVINPYYFKALQKKVMGVWYNLNLRSLVFPLDSIDGVPRIGYYKSMDIQKLSMDMATQRLQDQVGTAVMGMALKGAKEQGSEMAKMLETATLPTVRDSALGNRLDIQA